MNTDGVGFADQMFQAAQVMVSMAPVPGVAAAIIVIQEIYRLVKNVNLRENECQQLASYCGYIMWIINTQYQEVRNEIFAKAVSDLTGITNQIAADLRTWKTYNKGMKFVKNSEIGESIADHRKKLDQCMAMVAFAQATAQMSWNERFEAAQAQDSQLLNEILKKQEELNESVKEMQQMMKYWVPYNPGDPDGRNLTRAKDELFALRHLERRDTYTMPSRQLEGEVQKIGSRPAHAGSMYDIWKGIWLGEYQVALKVFRGVNPRDKDMMRIERQVDLWRAMKHKNILRLYGIVKLDHMPNPPMYFVSPWMKHKDAVTYCKANPDADRLRIIYDVAKGLEYIHSMGILHGGLQASNVLITLNGSAVISDFSLSKVMDPGAMYTQSNGPSASLRWMSPEAHNAEILTAQSDVYSWGMTALQILSLLIPFYNIKAMGQLVVNIAVKKIKPVRQDYPGDDITDPLWSLFEDCWKFEAEERPQVSRILEVVGDARRQSMKHPWNGREEGDDDDDEMDSEYPQSF